MVKILNSELNDLDEIFRFYELATQHMIKINAPVVWPAFSREMVINEIKEGRQWKLEKDGQIACVWATTFDDPLIWEERNEDPSVYIHRITTNPAFRGQNLVQRLMEWAKPFAERQNKKYIRLDTCGRNDRLIKLYQKAGFDFLGIWKLKEYGDLPAHYQDAEVCFFEMKIS